MKTSKKFIFFMLFFISTFININAQKKYAIVIHGGAGYMTKENLSETKEAAYIEKLNEALLTGKKILENGGTSIETVIEVIKVLENSPLFNAGKGAVFTHEGKNELDASIMDGKTLNAGAVSGVSNIKNPIELANKIMTNSKHVILSGTGASEFAKQQNLETVDPEYFFTEDRWNSLQNILKEEKKSELNEKEKHGTVGCVVLDTYGNLAAGTSTGGMTNKEFGRIGDSPIIGAGTYANNNTCAVSCTGHGEFFIRYVVAHSISALMEYKNLSLQESASLIINKTLKEAGGDGGLIAVDKNGNIALEFNTQGMFRGYIKSNGEKTVLIYK
ncbi:MAG: isoaspartyl peptidase/L-asparaginase [Bacteroidales bacterium]|nr:isoaspartyl peptidase/L-asparaginase [Bacteroidales bacterium]MBN2756710.1 isoaspartyl peptidase/L-asparaginase [Bacteroidales bacterium]